MSKNPNLSDLIANLTPSAPRTGKAKNPSIQEAGEQLRSELRTLADRAISAQKEASEIRAFILNRASQLAEAGVTSGMLKWRIRARITAAHKKTETTLVALQAAQFAFTKVERVNPSSDPIGALMVRDKVIAIVEQMAEKAEAYLQAAQEELAVWQDIAR